MLFATWDHVVGQPPGGGGGRGWDLALDGPFRGRFLLQKPTRTTTVAADQTVVVERWFEELKRLQP